VTRAACIAAAALVAAAVAPAQDELGLGRMWTFERPPLAYLQREYGFAPDADWWTAVRLASLRFGRGCSASFVSPRGLILTNHHCARDAIAKVQGDYDWVRDGFVARDLADEVRLEGLTVQQLVRTTDVTAAVEDGVDEDAPAEQIETLRAANRERVLAKARSEAPSLEPQLVKLFQGAVWQLYQYRVFDDVRLVMAPHLQISHFGGDFDNFVYPRYALDFAFCRAYEGGAPADTKDAHFAWSEGPADGELVFLTGNPGGTQRLLTRAQLEYQRDARYPRIRQLVDARIDIMREFAATSPEQEKRLRTAILGFENGQKLYRGEHAALLDPAFMARKDAAEAAFKARVARADREGELRLWDRMAEVMVRKRALEAPLNLQTAGGSPLLLRALAVLEFAAGGDAAKAKAARDVDCKPDPVQRAFFVDHLRRAREWLPAGDPFVQAALAGDEPEAAVARLERDSRIADAVWLDRLLAGGRAAIDACRDPALELARVLRPLAERNGAARAAVEAEENQLGARIARLLFAVYGSGVSPDATFTLRISDGRVRGYACNGSRAPWRTVFHGLFARHAEFDGARPFDLPSEWLLAHDRIDMRAPIDFVCTVDSTGGNSGSPVVNARRELVGLLFDGNIESLANEFLYGESAERSICVHPQGIVEALRKIYAAERLLREIAR
jgi:hypothetical protein